MVLEILYMVLEIKLVSTSPKKGTLTPALSLLKIPFVHILKDRHLGTITDLMYQDNLIQNCIFHFLSDYYVSIIIKHILLQTKQ